MPGFTPLGGGAGAPVQVSMSYGHAGADPATPGSALVVIGGHYEMICRLGCVAWMVR